MKGKNGNKEINTLLKHSEEVHISKKKEQINKISEGKKLYIEKQSVFNQPYINGKEESKEISLDIETFKKQDSISINIKELYEKHKKNLSDSFNSSLEVIKSTFKKAGGNPETINDTMQNLLNTMKEQPYNEVKKILLNTIEGMKNDNKLINAFDNIGYILNARHVSVNDATSEYMNLIQDMVEEQDDIGIYCCDYRVNLVNDVANQGVETIGNDLGDFN